MRELETHAAIQSRMLSTVSLLLRIDSYLHRVYVFASINKVFLAHEFSGVLDTLPQSM